ncbi:bifunctional 2-polyprenyl-6-hydroxyphenol methylase/3-demethylubiquinol 3-O-methyltransferase UbiG [Actinoplanes sp. N902-109]|uniref:class I SAM-dependent methyltransferase n=1 Tax=Actinoplanes sp. (strain N902-109) TaxID=649831 RepID=UPI0003295DE1|nr:class I SAM-dependent methyltransferase [Actinoplanes sp. N902-109]AGL16903.1 SAM-dependent methyltransferase [Actinoplanes sp. N902-109]
MSTAVAPLAVFDTALRRAADGHPASLTVHDAQGTPHRIDAAAWAQPWLPGDDGLIARCTGATLDVGCGPGRLTYALNQLGRPALGIDVSATAVRLARARGATALRRDVFQPVPGEGRWEHLLLADGNVGIGGDPHRLLRRCRELLSATGRVHLELAAPGTRSWSGQARLSLHGHPISAAFGWAVVAADDLRPLTRGSGLRIATTWTEARRWFATLIPR